MSKRQPSLEELVAEVEELRRRLGELEPRAAERTVALEQEVAERRRAEEALRHSELQYRLLVENVPDVVWWADREGNPVFVSPNVERVFGWTPEEIYRTRGRLWFECVHPDDVGRVTEAYQALFSKGVPFEVEYRLHRPDGRWIWLHDRVAPLEQAGFPAYACGLASDVTRSRAAEEQVRWHREELARVCRLSTMGEMASALAHELNQPLSAAATYIDGCVVRLRAAAGQHGELLTALDKAADQARSAGKIVRRIGEFIRRRAPHRSTVNLDDLVREVVALAEPDLHLNQVRVTLSLAGTLPSILVDPIQIEQVLLNLVRNAIEAMAETPAGGRELGIKTSTADGGLVAVAVRDAGCGLAPEAAERMFEPFFTTKAHGMGMGLAISRSILEAHGGRLWAEPGGPRGAVVCFTLPACTTPLP
jgi:PAS domain S-box-containing protein